LKVGFTRDRGRTVGASEIGRCARNVAADKLALPVDNPDASHDNGFSMRGNVMEDAWIAPVLRRFVEIHGGKLLYSTQGEQMELTAKGVPLSATPDGLAIGVNRDILAPWGVPDIGPSQRVVFEMKSLDSRYGRHKLPKKPHVPQTLQQLGMIRRALPEHQPDWGAVVYCDASDYLRWDVFPVAYDEMKFRGLATRANRIMTAKDWNQFPPEGKIAGGSECADCPRARLCLGYLPWMPGEDERAIDPKQVTKIEKLAAKKHRAEMAVEKSKQRERDAEAALMTEMNKAGTRFVKGAVYTTVAKTTKSQDRYDVQKLKARVEQLGGKHDDCKSPTKPGVSLTVECV